MKGRKPDLGNVVPMKAEQQRHVPDAPDFMSSEGREVWERLAPLLVARDRLRPEYLEMLAAYCEASADFIRFTGEIAAYGSWYATKTRNGQQEKKRAAWGQRQDALATMRQFGALFGLSPIDDARLNVGSQGDLFDELAKQVLGTD